MGIGEEWGKRVWVDWQKALGLLKLQLPQAFRFHYPHNTVHDHHLLSTWEPSNQGWFQGVIDKPKVTESLELWSIPLICIISPVRACILAGLSRWTQTLSLTHSPCIEQDPKRKKRECNHNREETMEAKHERKLVKIAPNGSSLHRSSVSPLFRWERLPHMQLCVFSQLKQGVLRLKMKNMSARLYLNKQPVAFIIHPKQINEYSNINNKHRRVINRQKQSINL